MTYILVDTANTFFRARHVINGDADIKLGMAFHITLNSIRKAWQQFEGSHVIFCLEGRSWRKDYYAPYKAQRAAQRAAHTEKEADEEKIFWEAFDTFKEFITDKTNCTVLQNPRLEADDLIAGWIQSHPNDKHVIISTDTDFVQLIAPNVTQYNGVMETTITHEGIFDDKGKPSLTRKHKNPSRRLIQNGCCSKNACVVIPVIMSSQRIRVYVLKAQAKKWVLQKRSKIVAAKDMRGTISCYRDGLTTMG
jgi:5'-3' exonuclease